MKTPKTREEGLKDLNHGRYLVVNEKIERDEYKPYGRHDEKTVFKLDLFEVFEVTNHPRAEHLFKLAWEHGHSHGFHEVLLHFEEMVLLIQE